MFNFGLLGHEYDEGIQLLKRRLEDRGHRARVLNLTHLPRTIQTTLSPDGIIYDGYDPRECDCYYLTDMGLREPFFHVSYDRELWVRLRERYLRFASSEAANVNFAVALTNLIARIRPMVNMPRVYSYRLHYLYQLHRLADRSISSPDFMTTFERPDEFEKSEPLNLDEYKYWEVLSFPKTGRTDLKLWFKKPSGITYKLLVLGQQLMDEALHQVEADKSVRKIPLAGLPCQVVETSRKAAGELDVKFGEVTCIYNNGEVCISGIDPSPDIKKLEDLHNLHVSSALADYLIETAANAQN